MELRNVQRDVSTADANRLHENRYLSCTAHSDGSVTLSVELPKESADLVIKALELAIPQVDGDADNYADEPGGETSLDNTILLCSRHHRLLHEGGFEIKPGANGEWHFRNASGMKNVVT